MIGNLNNSQKNPSPVRKTENKVMTSSSGYDNTDDNLTLVSCSHLGYPTIEKRVCSQYCLTRTMLRHFARAPRVNVYQTCLGYHHLMSNWILLPWSDYQNELVDTSVMSTHPPDGGLYSPPQLIPPTYVVYGAYYKYIWLTWGVIANLWLWYVTEFLPK